MQLIGAFILMEQQDNVLEASQFLDLWVSLANVGVDKHSRHGIQHYMLRMGGCVCVYVCVRVWIILFLRKHLCFVRRELLGYDKISVLTREIKWYLCNSSNTTLFLVVYIATLEYSYMFRPSNLAIFRLYMRNLSIGYTVGIPTV